MVVIAASGSNDGSFPWVSPSLGKGWDKPVGNGGGKSKARFPPYDVLLEHDNLVPPRSPFLNEVMERMLREGITPPGGTPFSLLTHDKKKPPTAFNQVSNWCKGYSSSLFGVFTCPPRLCVISECRQSPFISDVRQSIGDDHVVLEGPFWAFPEHIPWVLDRAQQSFFNLVVPLPLSDKTLVGDCPCAKLVSYLLSCKFRSSFGIKEVKAKFKRV
jgi:hypothetical protein